MSVKSIILLIGVLFSGIAYSGPVIQHWNTSNGARVYFVPAPEIPMVDVQIVFDAGSARDNGKPGLAVLTNAMLAEGAGDLNADAIAERFESVGADFSNHAHRDMSVFSLRSLTDEKALTQATETMALILSKPTFPQDAFMREKNRMLTNLRSRKQSPGDIAQETFYYDVYGKHPYAAPPTGTDDSIKGLQRDELIDFSKTYFVARNAVVAIVGDLDRSKAEALAENLIGKMIEGAPAAKLPEVKELMAPSFTKLEFPSSQSHILVGQPGLYRGDADYFALYLGNHVLGGSGLVSRISDEVREKRGLSYSAYSYFIPMRKKGPFILGLQTRNESTTEALKVLKETLKKFVAQGPTEEELDMSKKNITGGFPLSISSNKKIVEYIAMIGFYDLPLDYLDTFNNHIQATTLEQIKDAFKRRIEPDKMATVIVGGAS